MGTLEILGYGFLTLVILVALVFLSALWEGWGWQIQLVVRHPDKLGRLKCMFGKHKLIGSGAGGVKKCENCKQWIVVSGAQPNVQEHQQSVIERMESDAQ